MDRYQVGKITDIPVGEIQRMKFFIDAVGLPMFTKRYGDGTVVQVQRVNGDNLIRVWPARVLSPGNMLLFSSRKGDVVSYHAFNCITQTLTAVSALETFLTRYAAVTSSDIVRQSALATTSTPYSYNGQGVVEKDYDFEQAPQYQAYTLDGAVIWSRTCSGGGDGLWTWSETLAPLMIGGFDYEGYTETFQMTASKRYMPMGYNFSNYSRSGYSMRVKYDVTTS